MTTNLTAILPTSGRVACADSISRRPLHIAWGTGDGEWTFDVPPPDINAAALINEVGRRAITSWKFVVPDDAGAIVMDNGSDSPGNQPTQRRFSDSPGNQPTQHMFVGCRFDFGDAAGQSIREIGLFVNTETVAGLPPGQMYFTPGEITAPGLLLYVQQIVPLLRSAATQEVIQTVITF